ncbi:TadE family type IV pilus minor pilin [Mobilicoccus sp.]|uniref:TadE family type IV pilus minor pilin n=1 Tax=Mobilicoccus sp. TaxID=2034349 RepID=UPI0028B2531E|nr:TadE family type IV pilus minor pilin [Mobilicoccus sp.]
MVTAEMAVTIPVVLLVLALVLTSVRVGIDQVRCVDAARAGARAAARGDDDAAVREVVLRQAPRDSSITLGRTGGDVVVTVAAPPVLDVAILSSLPAPGARAVGAIEGGVGGARSDP